VVVEWRGKISEALSYVKGLIRVRHRFDDVPSPSVDNDGFVIRNPAGELVRRRQ
jgi:hypothetical protein